MVGADLIRAIIPANNDNDKNLNWPPRKDSRADVSVDKTTRSCNN